MNTYIISKTDFVKFKDMFNGLVFHKEHLENEVKFKIALPKYSKFIKEQLNKANISWTKLV